MPIQTLGIFDSVYDWVVNKLINPLMTWLGNILSSIFNWIFEDILQPYVFPVIENLWNSIFVKSFATKTILSNLAADNSKIFILDPENEYDNLAKNLNGKMIDVGKATEGTLNPFQIILGTDDEEDGSSNSYNAHLQFLEEFFRTILPDTENDALEYLNNLFPRIYAERGIDADTDLSTLKPEDYPIFQDLFDKILIDFQRTDSEYTKKNLRVLLNYVSKFSEGGRNAHLWNSPSTLSTQENFVVFNFQSLLANRNNLIANAQMMLVLKYLDNEIIKNRDYNIAHKADRKIIVVIDEAHVFIDEKYPIALDFMYQLAKRIRKYNGMQIIITQNIKDFVGTEELARKSTAIINACQYSFIFSLAPNDMHDLCKLYEKAGEINESEQEQIINNPRGRAFVVTSPGSRTSVDIVATEAMQELFNK
jgi:conjugal transfer ATP-binding protein TraC